MSEIKIALAGNPNCGKTTLFNALTGSNQFVGNWPGVTVEKKEGKLKKHDGVTITDLPGIYSLSPYTLEEVVAREYLINERPDVILNIIDGTNLERNLYLTTQLTEIGIPVVVAVNMMDLVEKNGDKINVNELSRQLGCKVVEISALKGTGVMDAAEAAIAAANKTKTIPQHTFSGAVEHAIAHIEEALLHDMPDEQQRWYAIKIFERDEKVIEKLSIQADKLEHIENDIKAAEEELEDDAESIITNERYYYIAGIIKGCYIRKSKKKSTRSDKIDKIVTNRWLGLPIFIIVMFLVYYISMVTVGSAATDWVNDGVFGDGWHLLGIGSGEAAEAADEYAEAMNAVNAFIGLEAEGADELNAMLNPEESEDEEAAPELVQAEAAEAAGSDSEAAPELAQAEAVEEAGSDSEDTSELAQAEASEETGSDSEDTENVDTAAIAAALSNYIANFSDSDTAVIGIEDEETLEIVDTEYTFENLTEAVEVLAKYNFTEPDPADYGVWVPGIPSLIEGLLDALNVQVEWVRGLVLDGIVAGVGAVLGFVPQMLVLFLLLAILEACGYMARIAFVLDRIFRRFGLSGKSFIPILIGTGCGIPGIMASRTIENERDRRMTIMTTTFIPCGAKAPFIALIAGAIFGGSAWISTGAYFIGIAAIIISGIILKKTKMFAGDPAPFVMELPAYHLPTVGNVLRSMWERGWSFIKKAGTIILLSTILVWFLSFFGFAEDGFRMLSEDELNISILAKIGNAISFIFAPLGWGNWQATVAAFTGLVAKENIVGTLGILYGAGDATVWQTLASAFTPLAGFSFLLFNLLCAPCFAAMGAIKREMNSRKWFWFAIGYECIFAYIIAMIVFQIGGIFTGEMNVIALIVAIALLAFGIYMLVKPYKEAEKFSKTVKVK